MNVESKKKRCLYGGHSNGANIRSLNVSANIFRKNFHCGKLGTRTRVDECMRLFNKSNISENKGNVEAMLNESNCLNLFQHASNSFEHVQQSSVICSAHGFTLTSVEC